MTTPNCKRIFFSHLFDYLKIKILLPRKKERMVIKRWPADSAALERLSSILQVEKLSHRG